MSDELPPLAGRRVRLRRPAAEDAEARRRLGNDAEIVRMYGGSASGDGTMNVDMARRWVRFLQDHDHAWVIETDRLIGSIRLHGLDMHDRRASLAIGIDDRASLGQGLGPEAIELVLHYAFETLGLHRVSLRVVAYNTRAIRAYEKCGFVVEGREREAACVDGAWHDDIVMGMLASEFRSRRS